MARIIAGRFEQKQQADRAVEALRQRGFESDQLSEFFVNPPGQHDRFPVGGDRDVSPGAAKASSGVAKGALIGGAAGLAIGLAAAPVAGIAAPLAGAGVGTYTGSLMGALRGMKEPAEENGGAPANGAPPESAGARAQAGDEQRIDEPQKSSSNDAYSSTKLARPGGIMVAAQVPDDKHRSMAIDALRAAGARDIENAAGDWQAGRWVDFDPLKAPELIEHTA